MDVGAGDLIREAIAGRRHECFIPAQVAMFDPPAHRVPLAVI